MCMDMLLCYKILFLFTRTSTSKTVFKDKSASMMPLKFWNLLFILPEAIKIYTNPFIFIVLWGFFFLVDNKFPSS